MTFTSLDRAELIALIAYEKTMAAIERGRERWRTRVIWLPLLKEEE
jgi:hypothetical protein